MDDGSLCARMFLSLFDSFILLFVFLLHLGASHFVERCQWHPRHAH